MKSEQQYFEEGKTIQEYMEEMSQLKEESFSVYEQFDLPQDELADVIKEKQLHFLIITEDWCGDAMMINPIIRKAAEAGDAETRVALRDADTELIDRHLTNGGRAIPIVLILNKEGELVGKWGPRAPEVQKIVDKERQALPPKDDPSFKEKQQAMIHYLQELYKKDSALWQHVYDSFKKEVASI